MSVDLSVVVLECDIMWKPRNPVDAAKSCAVVAQQSIRQAFG